MRRELPLDILHPAAHCRNVPVTSTLDLKAKMPRITGAQVLSFLGFLLLVGVWTIIDRVFGQREAFRFWGLMLLVTSLTFTFMKRIPVTVGNTELKPLEGWRKAYVLIPTYAIGLAVSTFPHEVACAVNLKGYVCG